MPRVKQQAPKRAAVYSPEETPEKTADEGGDVMEDEEDEQQQTESPAMAPLPASGQENDRDTCMTDLSSTHDVDSESLLSEPSDRMSDVDSVKNEEVGSRGGSSRKLRAGNEDSTPSISPGSLEQMKAIYNSFLTSSYWPALGLGVKTLSGAENLPCTNNKSASNITSSSSSSSSSNGGSSSAFDWHQSAMAKTLQQTPPNALPLVMDPGLLSTIHLQRQNNTKLYGSIFTGASKFRCKGCSLAYETLVELTVHMNETGHYRDDNHGKDGSGSKCWSKPRKRSLLEMEGKEDAQKVLRCMYCGHSFESLQDLSVHMIKTKHYQKVPLKEPMPSIAAKMVSQSRKKLSVELDLLVPPSKERTLKETSSSSTKKQKEPQSTKSHKEKLPDAAVDVTNHHRGNQNHSVGSSVWQFESHKSQILKCMECGSSHDSLQELTAHMLVTGHFINVGNLAMSKKSSEGMLLLSGPSSPSEEKAQSIPLPPSSLSSSSPVSLSSPCMSPTPVATQIKQEADSDSKHTTNPLPPSSENPKSEKSTCSKYDYLTEEDLKESSPKGGSDILKSLENTVSSAIHKAQTGTPSWGGGYPSIHAAYQLPSNVSQGQVAAGRSAVLRAPVVSRESCLSLGMNQAMTSPAPSDSPPSPVSQSLTVAAEPNSNAFSPAASLPVSHPVNLQAMQELVKRLTEKMAKVEKEMKPTETDTVPTKNASSPPHRSRPVEQGDQSSVRVQTPKTAVEASLLDHASNTNANTNRCSVAKEKTTDTRDVQMTNAVRSPRPALDASTAIITNHSVPEQPFVNPLSALQSVMNLHLGKVAKPALRDTDPMSMLFKMSNSMADKVAVATPIPLPGAKSKKSEVCADGFQDVDKDQPIDLSKGKSDRPLTSVTSSSVTSAQTPKTTTSTTTPPCLPTLSSTSTHTDKPLITNDVFQENALADISDMVRNLTQAHGGVVSKAAKHSSRLERSNGDRAVTTTTVEDVEEDAPHRHRKGRQSNWNLQHLLILQAQFTASLRRSAEGKYVPPDLSLKERTNISHVTGLSMTTISHWLANVKYQLRRSGRTKFLKNLDSGQPAFFCSQCSTQIHTPAAYVGHLESHLGFSLKDIGKISGDKLRKQVTRSSDRVSQSEKLPTSHLSSQEEEGTTGLLGCKLCKQTFTSKQALRLHMSKLHESRTEDILKKGLEMET
ncbi:teashirt homolog 3-like [Engraulis encrasicolus]|uniref:teashirt homolog 3-like n=1 Tax=Engraulis encrasicolus TaxID=184585 RepID=UPI002FD0A539